MDFSKKRKAEENGTSDYPPQSTATAITPLSPEDIRKILQPLPQDQLIELLQSAALSHPDVFESIRSVADRDSTLRKLFIRGLAGETTTETLRSVFSSFGELEEAIVILDKNTGKSKGYGFVTFKHVDGAVLALKDSSKIIDGRMTVTQLAAAGLSGGGNNAGTAVADVSARKIYVGNVPFDISSDRLLNHFLTFGEIEEGPLGFDKGSGKSKGFAFFVYKTEEGARASLAEPVKSIDGHQVVCKFAVDNKKGKPGGAQCQAGFAGDGMPPNQSQSSYRVPMMGPQYGMPGGVSSNAGYAGGNQGPPPIPGNGYGLPSSIPPAVGNTAVPPYAAQGPSSLSSNNGGYGPGMYGGPQFGGPGPGEYGGRLPTSSVGMPAGGFPPDASHYGSTPGALPTQHQQPSQVPRVPPGGIYQGVSPYY